MINEWNSRTCISDLSKKWKKERPPQKERTNLLILLFNVECLNTHIADVDLLLARHKPHICILTGVGIATRKLPAFHGYTGIAQSGTNAFGGVAFFHRNLLK